MGETETGYGTREFAGALGLTIKVLRTDRGVERKDLADRAGISYSHLASIEAGQKQPSPQVLSAIAEALGIASHELLESVEHRRRRNQRGGSNPWWLTADSPGPSPPAAAPAMAVRSVALPGQAPYDSAGLAEFIQEIAGLAEHLGTRERAVLLDLARKLSRQHP